MTEEQHIDSFEWPNGQGFTPCTVEYRETLEKRNHICDLNAGESTSDLTPEEWEEYMTLDYRLDELQLAGHTGQGERI